MRLLVGAKCWHAVLHAAHHLYVCVCATCPPLQVTIAPPQALRQLGLEGVLVLNAPPGSPAAAAGILGTSRDGLGRLVLGDVIVGQSVFFCIGTEAPGDAPCVPYPSS